MITAVLVPLVVLVAAVLLERHEARIAPRETPRTSTDGVPAATGAARHLHVVRHSGGPAVPALAEDLHQAS